MVTKLFQGNNDMNMLGMNNALQYPVRAFSSFEGMDVLDEKILENIKTKSHLSYCIFY